MFTTRFGPRCRADAQLQSAPPVIESIPSDLLFHSGFPERNSLDVFRGVIASGWPMSFWAYESFAMFCRTSLSSVLACVILALNGRHSLPHTFRP